MALSQSTQAGCRIPLTQGRWALVDPVDYLRLRRFRWYYSKNGYASRKVNEALGGGVRRETCVYMHRQVLGIHDQPWRPGMLVVDHVNRDKLDNRRVNLRLVSHPTNMRNQDPRGKSGVVGVRQVNSGRWVARVHVNYRQIHIGRFDTLEEATEARRLFMVSLGE
jgi:hypothetical protein